MAQRQRIRAPLSESILVAIAKLVDDAQADRRDPSHSDLGFQFSSADLVEADPAAQGQTVGKAKRVRAVLSWALSNAPEKGEVLVHSLVNAIRGLGGFRPESSNYVGSQAIESAKAAFQEEGFVLTSDGTLGPAVLDTLAGAELTAALRSYVARAIKGVEDAALLVGTGKDLLEATAKHVIVERMGVDPGRMDLPTLLDQAFYALGIARPSDTRQPGEHPRRRLERALYEAGCAVNALRNKEGTGHGRPWLPSVTPGEARAAVETIGTVSGYLLEKLKPTAC
jgi:hypothetical protein